MIPELSISTKDLVFLEDGNDSIIDNMINFNKLCLLARCIQAIKDRQLQGYEIKPMPLFQVFIKKEFKQHDDEELYQRSIAIEKK